MNKVLSFLILSPLISACGDGDANYYLMGVPVFIEDGLDGPSKAHLKDATIYLINNISLATEYKHKTLKNDFSKLSSISFQSEFIDHHGDQAYGTYTYKKNFFHGAYIKIVYPGCMGKTAWFHEMMHHLLRHRITRGDSDGNHESSWWSWQRRIHGNYYYRSDVNEYCAQQNAKFPDREK